MLKKNYDDTLSRFHVVTERNGRRRRTDTVRKHRGQNSPTGYGISYCSHKLEPREQRYPTTELELLAIVYALQKIRYWVYNKKVIVRTLEYLNSLL